MGARTGPLFLLSRNNVVSLEQIPQFIWKLLVDIDGMLSLVALSVLVSVM
jgi:hypothetical protein